MTELTAILALAGAVSLLLWGIGMVHDGVMRSFGSSLRNALGRALKSPLHALGAGLAITMVLQSSTATGLMAASFQAGGVISLVPALAVMLGANIGTTLIVQVFSFNISLLFPALIFAGVVVYRKSERTRTRELGRIAVGLGLMLLALHLLAEAVAPVEMASAARQILGLLTQSPVLSFILAAMFTWIAHSSVATVLFVMSLAAAGVVSPAASVAMVLGANLGSALNPVFEGGRGDPIRMRLPLGNLANRIIGVALVLPFTESIARQAAAWGLTPAQIAADMHVAFNVVMALLFLPFLGRIGALLERWLPARVVADAPGQPLYLDSSALASPAIALANAAREVLRMVDLLEGMLRGTQHVFQHDDPDRITAVSRTDDAVDSLHAAVHRYLAAIASDMLTEEDTRRVSEILNFSINLEHIGDIIDKNLMELASKRIKHGVKLTPQGLAEVEAMLSKLIEHLRLSVGVFMFADTRSARQLVQEKEAFRDVEKVATQRHLAWLQRGLVKDIEIGEIQLDATRDIKRIDAHVAAAAYPLLERTGELKASRLVS